MLKKYNYSPEWYADSDYSIDTLTGFFESKVYTSLNNSILRSGSYRWGGSISTYSSSSGSSSWSSGSSGGGSSGGGGGGGGARGW